ncbi:hypothetical protein NK8_71080 (plasmid) [Caballeronia sp. NK8]|nr:hypothetical protein NK8_71080 [Caballeronia sp. NK8]
MFTLFESVDIMLVPIVNPDVSLVEGLVEMVVSHGGTLTLRRAPGEAGGHNDRIAGLHAVRGEQALLLCWNGPLSPHVNRRCNNLWQFSSHADAHGLVTTDRTLVVELFSSLAQY